jgi:flagellin
VNAVAAIAYNGNTAVNLTASSVDGRTFRDNFGNVIKLNEDSADTVANLNAVVQVSVGSAQFQIGANVGQTVNLSINNVGTSSLGISGLDITTAANAASAMNLLDNAITRVSTTRGDLGSFMRNILDSNQRSLAVAKENITATESSIRDTDVAEEMTQFTKLQILQQSGLAVLAQANQAPQAVLSLLRG